MRQISASTAYLLNSAGNDYVVTLTRIDNDAYGNPRFEASIVSVDNLQKHTYSGAYRYRFTGHYFNEHDEAKHVLEEHIKRQAK